jgi:hypothetical protein
MPGVASQSSIRRSFAAPGATSHKKLPPARYQVFPEVCNRLQLKAEWYNIVSISSRLRLEHLSNEWCPEIVSTGESVSIQLLVADSRICSTSDRDCFRKSCAPGQLPASAFFTRPSSPLSCAISSYNLNIKSWAVRSCFSVSTANMLGNSSMTCFFHFVI